MEPADVLGARPVEREKLPRLFEASRWAPSSGNDRPRSFVVATVEDDEATHEVLEDQGAGFLTPLVDRGAQIR